MGLRVGPKIDLFMHSMWDLTHSRILEWVLWLVQNDRVWYIHTTVPRGELSLLAAVGKKQHLAKVSFLRTMVVDLIEALENDFDKQTLNMRIPDCFDQLRGDDANFEMVSSSTI